ncbi:hypothetical protein [Azotobacter chroococcum]|jgi:hypothetical protein|uniref:hypothetical protein n=1 Tax=Azotobacter chroococcum TaxID=353 RepID=UPI0010ADC2C9|nr:hypothetical protein [Azotobacter chroococcum]TKD46455.1 hypothetical protein FCG41_02045 [Azotobacter chroococcum]
MKKEIAISLSLLSSVAFADPTIFGMELGVTTEQQLKSAYNVNHIGTNKYSNGNMYSVPVSAINFDGLQEVTTVFDTEGKLLAVLTTLPKSKFDYLHKTLGGKYKLVNQNIPFVGNKSAKYRDGTTEITLDAPHLSFQMSMNYIRDDLMKKFNQQSQAENQKKQANEASQL